MMYPMIISLPQKNKEHALFWNTNFATLIRPNTSIYCVAGGKKQCAFLKEWQEFYREFYLDDKKRIKSEFSRATLPHNYEKKRRAQATAKRQDPAETQKTPTYTHHVCK